MSELNVNNARRAGIAVKLAAAIIGLTVAVVFFLAYNVLIDVSGPSTNDAFVNADFTVLAPRVAGQVHALFVEDNQAVRKGQVLAQIDDSDYRAAVASAEADVAVAQATIETVSASMVRQQSLVDQAAAAVAATRANAVFARSDYDRYSDLAKQGAGSEQNAQQARARIATAHADVARDEAALAASKQQALILKAEYARGEATLSHARAVLDTARLNLSWTRIVAPIDGVVGQRSVRVGAYVTPGTPLLAIVPLDAAYVVANFQETQLTGVHPGQPAEVRVDTYSGGVLKGRVESLAPATGVTFAPLAPDNATGNFTKVVQRIPVKIVLQPGQDALGTLRVGMSVEAKIQIDKPTHENTKQDANGGANEGARGRPDDYRHTASAVITTDGVRRATGEVDAR